MHGRCVRFSLSGAERPEIGADGIIQKCKMIEMNKINKLNTLSKIEYGDDIHPIINPMQISQFGIF